MVLAGRMLQTWPYSASVCVGQARQTSRGVSVSVGVGVGASLNVSVSMGVGVQVAGST